MIDRIEDAVAAVGGTGMADRNRIQVKAWDEITRVTQEAMSIAARAKA